jgi:AP-2 complex subunit mu-1
MKKLLVALAILSLTGCATIQQTTLYRAWNMAKFDNNEYSQINSIRTVANLGAAKCGTPEVVPVVDNLYYKSMELKNYSASIPFNEETVKKNFSLIYELLDEVMDYGYPQILDADVLKLYITQGKSSSKEETNIEKLK